MFELLPLSLSMKFPSYFLVLTDFYIRLAPLQFKILDTEIKQIIGETGTGTVVTAFFQSIPEAGSKLCLFFIGVSGSER